MAGTKYNRLYKMQISFKKRDPAYEELFFRILPQLGVNLDEIVEEKDGRIEKLYFYFKTKRDIDSFLGRFGKLALKNISTKSLILRKKDWQDKWKKNYGPFRLTKTFTVVPAWFKNKKKWDIKKTVFLDVGLAFGSGLHPTTKFIAQLIESKKDKLGAFLDAGTGTGILSVMAHKLGAKEIWCIDFESDAVKNAKENFKLNLCRADHLEQVDLAKFRSGKKFDFIAANLRTDVLLDNREKLVSRVKQGGHLAISGISADSYKELRRGFDGRDLRCLRVMRDKDWRAVLYRRCS